MPAFHCPAWVCVCTYQDATAPDSCLKLYLPVSSLRFLLEGYQKNYKNKDAKPTGSAVSYLNTNIHNSFTIFYIQQDVGQADVDEFLENPQHGLCEATSSLHYLIVQKHGEAAW